jgi:signal peptidase I
MKKYLLTVAAILSILFCLYILVGFVFNRVMSVPTGAMANTIIPGELILTSRFYSEIKRGDIMVFKYPGDPKIPYIKRVIGMPGETIQIRGQKVFINNQELQEKRIQCELLQDDKAPLREISTEGTGNYSTYHDKDADHAVSHQMKYGVNEPLKIPAGEYFVLGDSRENSLDSRYWGTVKANAMLFKARSILTSPVTSRSFTNLK